MKSMISYRKQCSFLLYAVSAAVSRSACPLETCFLYQMFLPRAGFMWLLAGGIIYTVGGIIYAMKLPFFNSRHRYFGSHEIFHLFVMGGSLCHYVMMYRFVA